MYTVIIRLVTEDIGQRVHADKVLLFHGVRKSQINAILFDSQNSIHRFTANYTVNSKEQHIILGNVCHSIQSSSADPEIRITKSLSMAAEAELFCITALIRCEGKSRHGKKQGKHDKDRDPSFHNSSPFLFDTVNSVTVEFTFYGSITEENDRNVKES